MKPTTEALHLHVDHRDAFPAVTPLFQSSAFEACSDYFYTRKNNPNIAEYERVVAHLEGAGHAVAVTTGMAALAAVLGLLEPGATVVVNKHVYGCSYKLFQRFGARWKLEVVALDLSRREGIEAIPRDTGMVIFETPTNPFLYTVDVGAVSRAVKAGNPEAVVVVDNTWATPLYQHPLELGADVSLHSATKYFSGHSDVMGGILLTDRQDLHDELRAGRFYTGSILDPHSAWLLRRSLQTLELRLARHFETAAEIARFLRERPEVETVYYPQIDGRQLTGYGGLIFFQLREELVEGYPLLAESLKLFGTGTGMACVTSMVAQPYSGSHASMTAEEKAEMGLDEGLVRLSLGLEDPDDLKADLASALALIAERAAPSRAAR